MRKDKKKKKTIGTKVKYFYLLSNEFFRFPKQFSHTHNKERKVFKEEIKKKKKITTKIVSERKEISQLTNRT